MTRLTDHFTYGPDGRAAELGFAEEAQAEPYVPADPHMRAIAWRCIALWCVGCIGAFAWWVL